MYTAKDRPRGWGFSTSPASRMLFSSLVRLLRVPLPLQRIALPKKGGEIARDECEEKEQQTFDSHVVINLISVRTRADQKCTYLQRALILSRVKLKTRRFEPVLGQVYY
jgi:hypothetical protein